MDTLWRTFGCRLIYDALNAIGEWVVLIQDLPLGSRQREVTPGMNRDDGRIPKMAAFSLARPLWAILRSEGLPAKFRHYMTEVVVGDLKSLPMTGDGGRMRAGLVKILVAGGDDPDPGHAARLHASFAGLNPVLRGYVEDLAEALTGAPV